VKSGAVPVTCRQRDMVVRRAFVQRRDRQLDHVETGILDDLRVISTESALKTAELSSGAVMVTAGACVSAGRAGDGRAEFQAVDHLAAGILIFDLHPPNIPPECDRSKLG